MNPVPVLHIENLSVSYNLSNRWVSALHNLQLTIEAGEIYGLVGESGSGKSTAAGAIMRFLPPNGRLEPGSIIELKGVNIAEKSPREMRSIWGKDLNLVPQNPGASLNPSMRIGDQLAESLLSLRLSQADKKGRVIELLRRVNLPEPETIVRRFPHELSGGQQQRVMIAMALSTSPRLLIMDEPTTNLDVTTEATILDLIQTLIREESTGALYITHNLGVVAHLCDRAAVMYGGEILEDGAVVDLFSRPLNPYTIGLLNSVPRVGQTKQDRLLATIPGQPPLLGEHPHACVYAGRCPLTIDICRTEKPRLEQVLEDRLVRCHRWEEVASGTYPEYLTEVSTIAAELEDHTALLEVDHLSKKFTHSRTIAEMLIGRSPATVEAVNNVSLSIQQGRTYGLVGESGSGKTTLARMIIGLTEPSSGRIELVGADLLGTVNERSAQQLAQLQMVFQNPQTSLNPYLSIGEALRRPLIKLGHMRPDAANQEARRLLKSVNLREEYVNRYPAELSGGEKQRVAIARAFASNPSLIVCDEPVSSLDVSVQSAVLNLLVQLQEEHGTAYLLISHDLAVVGYLADYVAVMYLGELYEVGYAKNLFSPPLHPYTEALISAIPVPDPSRRIEHIHLSGDIPSPRYKPTGCAFHTRCPHKLGAICETDSPPWQDNGGDHFIRCHRSFDELADLQSYLLSKTGA